MAKRFYVVKNGRIPGIYRSWDECKQQVDGYPGAVYKGFAIESEAKEYLAGSALQTKPCLASKSGNSKPLKTALFPDTPPEPTNYPVDSIIVYTDGSCLKNPGGPGGYAAIIQQGKSVKELTGSEPSTTNNRMEMKAAITALSYFDQPATIILHTDSQYLRRGLADGWVEKWKRNGWITKAGTPVLNKELWQELDRLNCFHKVMWKWVKGHHGNPLNERCDELAVGAATNEAKKIGWKAGK
ncbi:ribonuclease HI [Sporomusa acidovorans]|uniref:Ribonuclease H n=1 Tax=Sporomusa acidovorans (strain ATCC 49682 / DSM 3132 / Mol) TaxID=1123286 RepID=A0ABZ3JAQ9_SPOA4|nr:ribonuclease HI [Sporomusa acidovorans]OZC21742.1 ribonuclease HI [Sporomusa acidovorans DSM 3132]SDD58611.1 ribonuclease HI [Sporomusa acidovorans]